jgi:hypothetical protein
MFMEKILISSGEPDAIQRAIRSVKNGEQNNNEIGHDSRDQAAS